MEKKDSIKGESSSNEQKNKRNVSTKPKRKDKDLPWWVELLFVQIGLPDKWLIKLLKTKKNTQEFYKNEKKVIFLIIFSLFAIGYLQPVIKYSRTKLKCQNTAKDYILRNSSLKNIEKSNIRMFSVNFCNGGNAIDKLGDS